nr:hypothetical protein CFP56_21630 [Quercus suber]
MGETTFSLRASSDTDSPNLARQTNASCSRDVASGSNEKVSTAMVSAVILFGGQCCTCPSLALRLRMGETTPLNVNHNNLNIRSYPTCAFTTYVLANLIKSASKKMRTMTGMNAEVMPVDLLHVLSSELAARLDLGTLYNCVISSRYFANAGAVNALYRTCHESNFADAVSVAMPRNERHLVAKWSVLWSSIIKSAMGTTMFPYCRYLRLLDLQDLNFLLETLDEPRFRNSVGKQFFDGDFTKFYHTWSKNGARWRVGRLNIKEIMLSIGDEVIGNAPLLSSLTEPNFLDILSEALPRWVSKLGHLRELTLWNGRALADEGLQNQLHKYASALERLSIYTSTDTRSDDHLAAFIGGMRANTLVVFENISQVLIKQQTCLALTHHGKSLTTLKLALAEDGILALGFLQGCTNIESLSISSLGAPQDLKATYNDSYLEILKWLTDCNLLKDITFNDLPSAPDLLLPLLLNADARIQRITINSKEGAMYTANDHHDFHEALKAQIGLRALCLRADPEPPNRDGIETLLDAICSLKELRVLNLTRISDYFTDEHINLLATQLPQLTSIYVGGYGISDSVLEGLSGLKTLRQLNLAGITSFTIEGILHFIENLGLGNQGLLFSVDMADPDTMLSQEAQDLVKDAISAKVAGTFEYQPLRDPSVPEFDQSDSD